MTNRAVKFYKLLRSTARERRLGTVILFVTSRCNARCETCFYWQELNRPGDMTFGQIERLSATMPEVTDLWLSGGEPTLRRDLNEIINLFVRRNGVRRVIVPTNALVESRACEVVSRALAENPEIELYLNVALDGYGETHDRVRGVPGNWQRTLGCLRALYPLKDLHGGRFRLNVNTVVCAENYAEVEQLSSYLWENFRLDGHYFNIIRGETKAGASIKRVPAEVLPNIYAHAARLTERYGRRMFAGDDAATRLVKQVAYVGAITTHYRTQLANFDAARGWDFPCTAGETAVVVDYDGRVRACELRDPFASLADYDYDFAALWSSQARAEEVREIDAGRACWCTHVCFIHDSMRHSRGALLYGLPKNYLARGRW